jgi:hypothetical protein
MWMWAILMFQRYMLPPSSGLKHCFDKAAEGGLVAHLPPSFFIGAALLTLSTQKWRQHNLQNNGNTVPSTCMIIQSNNINPEVEAT